jgi:putative ABC transport system substrate-binding protein
MKQFWIFDFGFSIGGSKNKTAFVLASVALLLALRFPAEAQQPKKVPRIGYLSTRDPASESPRSEAVRLGLRELGYIEGQNIAIEYRYSEGKRERFSALAAELVRLKVDIIVVAGGDPAVREAMNATKSIPIVMSGGGADPVEAGFVESLARPGGNVTGITLLVIELGSKRLELLKEAVPKVARVAVLYESANPSSVLEVKEVLPGAARALGLTIRPWGIRAAEEFERVFTAQSKERPDGLYVSTGALMNTNQKRIVSFALKSRLPSVYGRSEYVDNGGLMYYGADLADSYRRVAYFVDRILKGARSADLPVERPKKFELVINLKTAKQIGLTIPPNVLARADKVIK